MHAEWSVQLQTTYLLHRVPGLQSVLHSSQVLGYNLGVENFWPLLARLFEKQGHLRQKSFLSQ